jgi:hypothetical protein
MLSIGMAWLTAKASTAVDRVPKEVVRTFQGPGGMDRGFSQRFGEQNHS